MKDKITLPKGIDLNLQNRGNHIKLGLDYYFDFSDWIVILIYISYATLLVIEMILTIKFIHPIRFILTL